MDNDKTILEKFTDVVKSIVDTAIAPDPKQVAEEMNEQVYLPDVTDAAAAPVFITPKKAPAPSKRIAKTAPAAKAPAKKAASKTTAKSTPKKSAKKAAKKATKKAKKTAKQVVKKKKAKKSKR